MTKGIQDIFDAYESGHSALLVTGRSLYDLDVSADGKMRPLIEILRLNFHQRYGMHVVTYSLATGIDWNSTHLTDQRDRKLVEEALRTHGLLNARQDQNDVVRVVRGISSLSRAPASGLKWADGNEMRFAFMLEFCEHLVPGTLTNGTQTDAQLVAIELAHITAQSLALRSSGNLVIFYGREGLVDDLVASALHSIRLSQPGVEDKMSFFNAASQLYSDARFEEGMTSESVVHLTVNTPNRGLESIMRASHLRGQTITTKHLTDQKNQDVAQLSENTLTVLDTSRVEGLELHGANIEAPRKILTRLSAALSAADRTMPANILLCGPPGVGKTDLAILAARDARTAIFQLHTPKSPYVGETERKARMQQEILKRWSPNVSFIDEIVETLPLERSEFDGDSGASRAVTAQLLTSLSDESRRGQNLLIGATNIPWRIGAAMLSRFTILPVLFPLERDFPGILVATAKRIMKALEIDPADERIAEASRIFHAKGANPRHMRAALSNGVLLFGTLTAESILRAANDLALIADPISTFFCDLWALKVCSSKSFLPWSANPGEYPFPPHLQGIVNPSTGELNHDELDKRIESYRSLAKV